ncbi:hypothetical protein [Anaeromyxobacter paludicola]|uniref:Extracellular repeat protein, HAF family n=1 Tax=Anaeromyxobacter paludicola TaxID=2918171 RepID=A0ABM7X978_9BACT|nr:hypothetical protein [Anaeromyxobacter paludicola]BDG08382.1 hypothetical protein AMPC_14950 [Anaeromyxobacter paludicola]
MFGRCGKLVLSSLLAAAPLLGDAQFTTLGSQDGISVEAHALNDLGQVAGTGRRAVLWRAGTLLDLGTLGGSWSSASALNDSGQVVGVSETATGASHAFLWESGAMQDLGTPGGASSSAVAVNDARQVAGNGTTAGGASHAFLWSAGTLTDLGTLGGASSAATALGAAGQVVGESATATGDTHAFLWQAGTMLDLGTLGGATSRATAVNAAGQVVGDSTTATGDTHAFLWQAGTMLDLGTLGGTTSRATAVNAAGQVVGESAIGPPEVAREGAVSGETHAFLWQAGTMQDLNAFPLLAFPYLAPYSGATAVNALGEATGLSRFAPHTYHSIRWGLAGPMQDVGTCSGTPQGSSQGVAINDFGQITGSCPPMLGSFFADVSSAAKAQRLTIFFERMVAMGALTGLGPDSVAGARIAALGGMIGSVEGLVAQGQLLDACQPLHDAALRMDGRPRPPDFATGPALPRLRALIGNLQGALGCD